ncbi:MAG: hypothetical protein WCG27_00380 [Pseudomonadota bacterium]
MPVILFPQPSQISPVKGSTPAAKTLTLAGLAKNSPKAIDIENGEFSKLLQAFSDNGPNAEVSENILPLSEQPSGNPQTEIFKGEKPEAKPGAKPGFFPNKNSSRSDSLHKGIKVSEERPNFFPSSVKQRVGDNDVISQLIKKNEVEVFSKVGLPTVQQGNIATSAENLENVDPKLLNLENIPQRHVPNGKMAQLNSLLKKKEHPMNLGEKEISSLENTPELEKEFKNIQAFKQYNQGQQMLEDNVIRMKDFHRTGSIGGQANISQETGAAIRNATLMDIIGRSLNPSQQGSVDTYLVDKADTTKKVLDLSHINTQNQIKLVNKIVDYLQQNAIINNDQMEVTVYHQDLGQFVVQAQKDDTGSGREQVKIEIKVSTDQGQNFFQNQQENLKTALLDVGVKLTDMKISFAEAVIKTPEQQSSSSSSFSSSNSKDGNQQPADSFQRQHSNREHTAQDDSRRRQELWALLNKQREA